ncbi:hypothetical protein [Stakelama marina]|uniref:Uncharacterized protein n=1 Tax=Stakelama marina TaxID=2826939 RepID=A0A8T4ID11_9SPHN|nr:hypothetical protein [Stakelama marina]MBR0551744.1 hypothetical protein [Stakelama marina]
MIGLSHIAEALGCKLTVQHSQRWTIATFAGERVELVADRALPADVGNIAFPDIPGALIADAASDGHRLELLLVDDGGQK